MVAVVAVVAVMIRGRWGLGPTRRGGDRSESGEFEGCCEVRRAVGSSDVGVGRSVGVMRWAVGLVYAVMWWR